MLSKLKHITLASSIMMLSSACVAFQGPEIDLAESGNRYTASTIVKGVEVPWGMTQLPNSDILVTDRKGELRLIREGKLVEQPVQGLPPVVAGGQGGLLDIVLHPDYGKNGWLYMTMSSPEGEGEGNNTALYRAKFDGEKVSLKDAEMLYKGSDNTTKRHHYGSRIAFDNNGYVFFSIGDRGERDVKPQDLSIDGGKVYRLHDDGRVPKDNPFVGQENTRPATYSYGHRNPQGMAKHPETGKIWSHEHGPRGGDEINIIKKGVNYGWPVITYGVNYSGTSITDLTEKPGMEQPDWYWDPSIAPSGMVFVTSDKYPEWKGKLLIGSLKFHYLVLMDVDGDKVTGQSKMFEGIGRVRSIMQGLDGYLYVGVDGGGIKRIEPKA
ncbi:PQQ-dependent sugar dehydrogenase [Thalassotalea euphylliae]|uniref:PQQ-dependent sugar dehydrogenase n=1 Tax=Thalassotalea euphylliae TaxID=1655234 RepID=UPI00362704BB